MPKLPISLIGILLLVFVFPAQGNQNNTRKVRWAHVYEQTHPLHKWALWASDQIYHKTNQRYKIVVYPSSTLGKEAHINQGISLGTIDIIYTGVSFASQIYKPLGLSELPYVFKDYDHWLRFISSDLFNDLSEQYRVNSNGNRIISSTYYGERHLTANREVLSPDAITGLKIRVPGSAVYQIFPVSLGAKPSPIAFSEVYLAIQQGVVDAQENPLPTIKAKKLYEVQSHINLTGHILGSILTVVSGDIWRELSDEDQATFKTVLQQAAANASAETRANEHDLVDWFESQNIVVKPVEREKFRQKVLNYLTNNDAISDPYIYKRMQEL